MQPEDMSGGGGGPGAVERRLLIRSIPKEAISAVMLLYKALGKGEHTDLDLGDYIDQEYLSEWKVLSHTFSVEPDGGALLTLLIEALSSRST
jgi:hypothetical protein